MNLLIRLSQVMRRIFYVNPLIRATKEPLRAQTSLLFSIIHKNRDTLFGNEHRFAEIGSIEDFQKHVPVNNYDSLKKYIEMIKSGKKNILSAQGTIMFAITSGTTGEPKFIPVTKDFIKEYRAAWQSWTYFALKDHPRMLNKSIITFVSPAFQGKLPSGIPYGSISGLLQEIQPGIIKRQYGLATELFRIKDYDARYYVIARVMLEKNISLIVTPNPSLILIICKKLISHQNELISDIEKGTLSTKYTVEKEIREQVERSLLPDPSRAAKLRLLKKRHGALYPKNIWKDIVLIGCWKEGNMPLYLKQIPKYFGNIKTRDIGLMASEGRVSIPITDKGGSGVISLTSHFYEFIPEEEHGKKSPKTLTVDKLELNKTYFVLLTASNGLYRYDLNDIVKVVGFYNKCPVIDFLNKGEHVSSITGEKLSEWQVVTAVRAAAKKLKAPVHSFTACIHWGRPPAYAFHMEFHDKISKAKKELLIKEIDMRLKGLNREYRIKRESMRLGNPILRHVEAGSYHNRHRYLVLRGAHDAQVKHPCLVSDVHFEKHFKEHLKIIDEVRMA